MRKGQIAFIVLSLLVVCSVAAGGIASVVEDSFGNDDSGTDLDPQEFNASERSDLEDDLRREIEENPQDDDRISFLAQILASEGRIDEAIPLYEQALAIDPNNAATRLNFGISLYSAGKPADAEIQFLKILQQNPNDAEAHYYLAQTYESWDPPRMGEAVAHYQQVLTLAPGATIAQMAADALSALGVGTPVASPPA